MHGPAGVDNALCPQCLAPAPASAQECPSGHGELVVGGRLLLLGAFDAHSAGRFRGLWRTDAGTWVAASVRALDLAGVGDWRAPERLGRAVDSLASLRHPLIAVPLGQVEAGGRLFAAQVLVEGRTLSAILAGAPMPADAVRRLARDLLDVLSFLHDHHVILRDLLPENVIVDDQGRAHVIDLGGACKLGADDRQAPPAMAGHPRFMAPEQMRGEHLVQSDFFALGQLLMFALDPAVRDPALRRLLAQLVDPDWKRRPATTAEIAQRLDRPARTPRRLSRPALVAMFAAALTSTAAVVTVHRALNARAPVAAVSKPVAPPATVATVAPKAPAAPSLETLTGLPDKWIRALRDGDAPERLYAPTFSGVRVAGGMRTSVARADWIATRSRLAQGGELDLLKGFPVRIVEIDQANERTTLDVRLLFLAKHRVESAGCRWVVQGFEQPRIEREEEGEHHAGFSDSPAAATSIHPVKRSCARDFDPGGGRFWVTGAEHSRYVDAAKEARELRTAGGRAEIVGLSATRFVVVRAAHESEDAARAEAERASAIVVDGRAVLDGAGAPLRLAHAPLRLPTGMVLLSAGAIWSTGVSMEGRPILTRGALDMSEVRPSAFVELPTKDAAAVLTVHAGAPHVMTESGRWLRFDPTAGARADAKSITPDPRIGIEATLGGHRFSLDERTRRIRVTQDRVDAGHVQLGADHARIYTEGGLLWVWTPGLYRMGSRLGQLAAFEPARGNPRLPLGKLCGEVAWYAGKTVPAQQATLDGMRLQSDETGRLEIWLSAPRQIADAAGDWLTEAGLRLRFAPNCTTAQFPCVSAEDE